MLVISEVVLWGYGPYTRVFTHFSETDQICARADCKKRNGDIFSSQVSNKNPWISASFELWYINVIQFLLSYLKTKLVRFRSLTNNVKSTWDGRVGNRREVCKMMTINNQFINFSKWLHKILYYLRSIIEILKAESKPIICKTR